MTNFWAMTKIMIAQSRSILGPYWAVSKLHSRASRCITIQEAQLSGTRGRVQVAERDVWNALKSSWRTSNLRGRIKRLEIKGETGFSDALACIDGLTYYIELKHCPHPLSPARPSSFFYGVKGSQALNAHQWARAGAPAYIVIGHNPRPPFDYCIYEGNRAMMLYESRVSVSKGIREAPEADLVFHQHFSWRKLIHHHQSLTEAR
jgi:hypothetical protein